MDTGYMRIANFSGHIATTRFSINVGRLKELMTLNNEHMKHFVT